MLRSIIAIWCVALGLVIVAATAGCGWGGCANGDDCSGGLGQSGPDLAMPAGPDMTPAQCTTTCPPCSIDHFESCFEGSFAAQVPGFCAVKCKTDDGCFPSIGEICAQLFGLPDGPACIRPGSPKGCGTASPNWHCDLAPASCKDATTLSKPFSHPDDRICGWELVNCPNGCQTDHCL